MFVADVPAPLPFVIDFLAPAGFVARTQSQPTFLFSTETEMKNYLHNRIQKILSVLYLATVCPGFDDLYTLETAEGFRYLGVFGESFRMIYIYNNVHH